MKKSLIAAGAASVALAAMPVLGVFADDDTSVTDTIQVTVSPSCTFRTIEGTASAADTTYSISGANGELVQPLNSGSNVHTFNVFCNKQTGYSVTATAHDLTTSTTGINDTFQYKATLDSAPTDGQWHAEFAAITTGLSLTPLGDSTSGTASGTILTRNAATATAGESWTATYTARIGTATQAALYTGTIEYTLNSAS